MSKITTPEQQKANAMAWLAALESGEYQQGKHYLRQDGKEVGSREYCCLGVACELSGLGKWMGEGDPYTYDPLPDDVGFNHRTETTMPSPVRETLGFHDSKGWIYCGEGERVAWKGIAKEAALRKGTSMADDKRVSLTILNDTGFTFKEIAALIRDNLPLFFAWAEKESPNV